MTTRAKAERELLQFGMDFAQSTVQEVSGGAFFHEFAAGSMEGCLRTRSVGDIQEGVKPCSFHD
jgi:hypothetical protein